MVEPRPDAHERLGLLLTHYQETFSHLREYIRSRNRLFAYSLVAIAALALRASDGPESERLLKLAIEGAIGSGANIDGWFLSLVLWFAFFAVVARYFQAVQTVNRQYEYIDRVEAEIADVYGKDTFSREGTGYLHRYPLFGSWMDVVYTWAFPIGLLTLVTWSASLEVQRSGPTIKDIPILVIAAASLATISIHVYSSKFEFGRALESKTTDSAGTSPVSE